MSSRLGELLVKANLITQEQLKQALGEQKATGGRLGFNLTKLGFLKEEELTAFLSKQYNVPAINLSEFDIDQSLIKLIPLDVAKKYMIIPVNRAGSTIILAMSDPSNIFALDDIKFMTGYNVEAVVAAEGSIIDSIKKHYMGAGKVKEEKKLQLDAKDYSMDDKEQGDQFNDELDTGGVVDVDDFDSLVSGAIDDVDVVEEEVSEESLTGEVEAPIIKLVNGILIRAAKTGVSDIHIEPYEKTFRVRYRLDGSLKTVMGLPIKIKNAITSRVKIMASLDIAERRLPRTAG